MIMAGGSGERFWPLSRQHRPKQLLRLTSGQHTLLEEAVLRVEPLFTLQDIHVATSRKLMRPIRSAGLPIPRENVLAEPDKRNTAGAICWAAAELLARHDSEDVTMAILTSDHTIGQPSRFRADVKAALAAAEREDALVIIGVQPTRPETGYGYIEAGEKDGQKRRDLPVDRFREKPNQDLAQEFLESGHHYWNSGMFFWKVSVFLRELELASPLHAQITRSMAEALSAGKKRRAEREFERLPNLSIDYALMEKAGNVRMIPAGFSWDDVGSWDSLDRAWKHDADGNITEGDPVLVDTHESIVLNEAGEKKMAVGVLGMENVVVIVSGDAVLIAPKSRAQDVRQIAREFKRRGARQV